jgi:hypothetical protein
MRDEKICRGGAKLEVGQKLEYLGSDEHVESADRLIEYYDERTRDECSCDACALLLSSREFVRITSREIVIQTDVCHRLVDAFAALPLRNAPQWFTYARSDSLAGIE